MGLKGYIAKKILFALVAFFVALTVVFFLYHVMPGNPADIFAQDPRVPPEVRDNLLERWGLNEPLWKQYGLYLKNILQGDFGYSFLHRKPVITLIAERLPWSLLLLGSAFLINGVVGISLGSFVAWKRGSKLDTTFVLTYNIYNALPLFFVGMMFIAFFGFFARTHGSPIWFPFVGAKTPLIEREGTLMVILDVLWHLVLPLSTLVIAGILGWSWFMRGNLINVKTEDYIQTAKAKGLSDTQVLYRHGMRNAILPVITDIGMSIGWLIGGSVLIETVFAYPGTGKLLFDAIMFKDYPLLQGSFIIIAGLTLLGLLIAELLYGFVDPRIRTA
ncbi:MAG: ABC transporter permease [Candidatus Heimdallarchaeota archaeon]|nr:ABC transporter permease [Candidatus Heimdallarchaeota archaeon]MCK4770560.1 ABC transporter permease [Candidatus Heimdallarchaeota archaeon]